MAIFANTTTAPNEPTAMSTEQDQARRLTEWAASPREGLPGWAGYDDEIFDEEELTPAEATFLNLLARDIDEHPERLMKLPVEMLQQMNALVGGIGVDLDMEIVGPVAIAYADEELPSDAD